MKLKYSGDSALLEPMVTTMKKGDTHESLLDEDTLEDHPN